MIRNALSFDVEDYFQVSAFAHVIDYEQWSAMPCRVEENTNRILDILDEKQVKATFFVLGWIAERYPQIVQRISADGHEVACHGYSHQLIYKQTIDEFTEETRKSKSLLEDLIAAPVSGYRAASYSITEASLWALDVLAELGFQYDSSIYPIHHDRYGIVGAPRFPHLAQTAKNNQITEFPVTSWLAYRFNVPVGGGGYFRLFPYLLTRFALKQINGVENQPFIFYLHPWEFDPDQPRVENAGWVSTFRHYQNLRSCQTKFQNLLQDFAFTTVKDVLLDQPELSLHKYSV